MRLSVRKCESLLRPYHIVWVINAKILILSKGSQMYSCHCIRNWAVSRSQQSWYLWMWEPQADHPDGISEVSITEAVGFEEYTAICEMHQPNTRSERALAQRSWCRFKGIVCWEWGRCWLYWDPYWRFSSGSPWLQSKRWGPFGPCRLCFISTLT